MSLEYITKKDKVQRCVINILSTFYGKPNWQEKPKDGQDPDVVLKEWISALGDYSEETLKASSYSLYKARRANTFPALNTVLQAIKEKPEAVSAPRYFNIESELMEKDKNLGKPFYTLGHYRRGVNYILNKQLKERLGSEEYAKLEQGNDDAKILGRKYYLAIELGLFTDFDAILQKSINRELNI